MIQIIILAIIVMFLKSSIAWARYYQYLRYVIRHKAFVFQECVKIGVPMWNSIIHDWDKFLPDEFIPYARCFYKPDGSKQYIESSDFTLAWNHHQKRNPHHWQYWMITWDRGETECLPMPDVYRREMLADWRGAGRAITGTDNTLDWYTKNRGKMKLHLETQAWIDEQLGYKEEETPPPAPYPVDGEGN